MLMSMAPVMHYSEADCGGKVTIRDATAIRQFPADTPDRFPVETKQIIDDLTLGEKEK